MQNWDDLKYLLALEEHGTLIRAAKHLKTNPTTVSRHIKRLSEESRETLVHMNRGGEWTLTEHGQRFVEAARRCQQEILRLEDLESEETQQNITISVLEFVATSFITPRIKTFDAKQHGINLTLNFESQNVSLAYGEADLAVRLGRPKSGRLVVSKLGDIEMGVFTPDGLPRRDWIGLPPDFDWVPEMQMGKEAFGHDPMVRIGSFPCIRRLAIEMDLACVGPVRLFEQSPGLRRVPDFAAPSHREAWSVFHDSRRQDQKLSVVRDWVKTCFTDRVVPNSNAA